jgi:hypothetical protein
MLKSFNPPWLFPLRSEAVYRRHLGRDGGGALLEEYPTLVHTLAGKRRVPRQRWCVATCSGVEPSPYLFGRSDLVGLGSFPPLYLGPHACPAGSQGPQQPPYANSQPPETLNRTPETLNQKRVPEGSGFQVYDLGFLCDLGPHGCRAGSQVPQPPPYSNSRPQQTVNPKSYTRNPELKPYWRNVVPWSTRLQECGERLLSD